MTGREVEAVRKKAGMGMAEFGIALGYPGTTRTIERKIRRAESGGRAPVSAALAERVRAFVATDKRR